MPSVTFSQSSSVPGEEHPSEFCKRLLSEPDTTWHLIGIGGIGVSAVAKLLLPNKRRVRGSDVRESQITLGLRELGAEISIGQKAENLEGVDVVVLSTAIPMTNPEVVEAQRLGLPIVHRSHLLGAFLASYPRAIGVTGTHGKGTVSSSIQHVLGAGGLNCDFAIGGLVLNEGTNARARGEDTLVAEVDESDGSLVNVCPTHIVLNNLELDHLNYYDSWDKLESTVLAHILENPRLETLYANEADEGVRRLLPRVRDAGVRVRTFGLETPEAWLSADEIEPERLEDGRVGGAMTVRQGDSALGRVSVSLPGVYNLSNLLGALCVALDMGVDFEDARKGMASFRGLENRFTVVEAGKQLVVKDYISHPTGIRRVLEGAEHFRARPIVAVFKPYRFTMIKYLQDDYRDAFQKADHVLITELYTAGEVPIPGIDTEFLCNKIRESGVKVSFVQEMNEIPAHLQDQHADAGMVIFFGGDDLFGMADRYTEQIDGGQA